VAGVLYICVLHCSLSKKLWWLPWSYEWRRRRRTTTTNVAPGGGRDAVRDVGEAKFRATDAVKQKSNKGMVDCNSKDGGKASEGKGSGRREPPDKGLE
jgi:hypothetical protein